MSGDLKLDSSETTEREHVRWWNEKVAVITFEITRADILWLGLGVAVATVYIFGVNWDVVFGLRP